MLHVISCMFVIVAFEVISLALAKNNYLCFLKVLFWRKIPLILIFLLSSTSIYIRPSHPCLSSTASTWLMNYGNTFDLQSPSLVWVQALFPKSSKKISLNRGSQLGSLSQHHLGSSFTFYAESWRLSKGMKLLNLFHEISPRWWEWRLKNLWITFLACKVPSQFYNNIMKVK